MEILEIDGKKYLKLGDRAVPFTETDASGKPIIKATSERIIHEDGRIDTTIKIPFLTIKTKYG